MMSKTIAAALLVAGGMTAAAGGAYVAVRQSASAPNPAAATPAPLPAAASPQPVTETEAVVGVPAAPEPPLERPVRVEERAVPAPPAPPPARPAVARPGRTAADTPRHASAEPRTREIPREAASLPDTPTEPAAAAPVEPERAFEPAPAPPQPVFEEVVLPASSVIGLQVETALSSERAAVEDRVDARVTRDVMSSGRVAIPAGSRVVGAVTMVERGGKVKERARLGVRFHTLVLADGSQVPLRTEAILREGDPPSGESARKIGGAAVGGAILGAILGGGKGAMIGGATGAGAGTAAVMAGDRNAATLPAGTVVTVRLASPATLELERR